MAGWGRGPVPFGGRVTLSRRQYETGRRGSDVRRHLARDAEVAHQLGVPLYPDQAAPHRADRLCRIGVGLAQNQGQERTEDVAANGGIRETSDRPRVYQGVGGAERNRGQNPGQRQRRDT